MKTLFSLLFFIYFIIGNGQQTDNAVLDVDVVVSEKSTDFNAVFVPFYNTRDTLKYNELLSKSKAKGYLLGEIIALNLLGTYYRDQSNYKPSILLHNQALQLSENKNIVDGILYSNNMLGVVYRRMDNVERGLEYHFRALELAEQVRPATDFSIRNTAIAVNGIGNAYLILHEWESARKQFKRSFSIEQSIGNQLGLAINYQNIGITFEEMNVLDSALIYYQKSLESNTEINNDVGKMICFNSIAGILMKEERFREALHYIHQAEKIATEKGDNFYTTTIYLKKAKALIALNDVAQAEEYLNKSSAISAQHNLKANLAETHAVLSDFYQLRGDYQKALHHSEMSKTVETDFLNENNLRIKNNLEISYDVAAKANQILNLEKEKAEIASAAEQRQRTILILWLLLIALGLLGFLLYRQVRLKKEKQVLELEQKVLRAQMNPHFTFNALNSIKAYIISQDTENAVGYLNKFAKMIRGVLYASDRRINTLREELEMVESYVEIEKLRFKDPIDLKIYQTQVDLDKITVPPLLLQPFIENALWHGLAKKKGEKIIEINIYKPKKNKLHIEIIDNGIGREATQNNNPQRNHESLGINISKKRLQNHFNLSDKKCNVEYVDLYDAKGNSEGTKVCLCLPVSS